MNKYLTEFIGTFFLVLTVGWTVLPGNAGEISGGAFNPAVAVGIGFVKLVAVSSLWIHLIGDFAGGDFAGIVFKLINPSDK
jgi:aquaporin Z